ncbi:hypothetical protein BX616_007600 [Lobosporangium transversale]|uniref:Uncharacterized protein n=1 Tax=Lobosporangium transversale TaxID=64571 RepID=A0A1Y2G610_9FUNG|nr:hypothetical protein BCR41DRAFT_364746 [Lobosporangium transversale]KAF9918586.1 hypothetical protein BX616_007600 [Lobosporangium transversale]ORY96978.1 hypothetical protein BCR41DRAFT_364746 [Lobosporangium transversale]|eukprot:XP_021875540.1 hypothetical protein BCR41DRAFT_364746 [Lobosporangium transversale]
MKPRSCYLALTPIRALVALLTLSCLIAIAVSRKLDADRTWPPGQKEQETPLLATVEYFKDSPQLTINLIPLIGAVYLLYSRYNPNTSDANNGWHSSWFFRNVVILSFTIVGLFYGIDQLIKVSVDHNGCNDPFFTNTQSRCWVQYGVSSSEIAWAVLLIVESRLAIRQMRDQEPRFQNADEEVRAAALYQPDLSLTDNLSSPERIELTNQRTDVNDQPPEYTSERSRNQPQIVDATNPPERLAEAVARRLQSEDTQNRFPDPETLQLPPSYAP